MPVNDNKHEAECRNYDADIWYDPESYNLAKLICNSKCPMITECLMQALVTDSLTGRHGVWGGLTPAERAGIRTSIRKAQIDDFTLEVALWLAITGRVKK